MKKKMQVMTTYATAAAIAGVVPPPITFDLIGIKKQHMVDCIFMLCNIAYSNVVAGTNPTAQQALTCLGRTSFTGKFQEKMRFLSNVRIQTLSEIGTAKGYPQVMTNFGTITGAGAAANHTLMLPFYACKNKRLINPNETSQASEVFDRAHVEFNFGAIPAMGAGAPTAIITITPIIVYSERKGNYITPFREMSEEDKAVQTDILINSGFYEFIAFRPNPALATTATDTFRFTNNDEFYFNNVTAAQYEAYMETATNNDTINAAIALGGAVTFRTLPLFNNYGPNAEVLKGLPVKVGDNMKLDTTLTGVFVANTLIREFIHNIYDDADVIANLFDAKAVKLTPVTPVASPYVQHEMVAA